MIHMDWEKSTVSHYGLMGPCFIPCRPTWPFCSFSVYGGLSFFIVLNILPSLRPFLSGLKSPIGKTLGSSLGLRTPKLSLQFHQNLNLGKNWLFLQKYAKKILLWSMSPLAFDQNRSVFNHCGFHTVSSLSPLKVCYFITLCLRKLVGWQTNHLAGTELTADTGFVLKCSITVLFLIISINFNLPIFFSVTIL